MAKIKFHLRLWLGILTGILWIGTSLQAQWIDKVYQPTIHTVLLSPTSDLRALPMIPLESGQTLTLRFDDLGNEPNIYNYKVIHCTWNWESSELMENEYVSGINHQEVYTFTYSFNTQVPYIHYELVFPNLDLEIKKSGNYILQVFKNNQPDSLVLTRRFMVYEPLVNIVGKVKASAVVERRDVDQEVDFRVETRSLKLYNVFEEIHAVVLQNKRWDNAIFSLKPKFQNGNQLLYDHEVVNAFPGGNEYRNFDIKDLEYQSPRIAYIDQDSIPNRVFLHADEKRTFKRYTSWEDLNGDFIIKNDVAYDSNTEADYVWVYFTLPFDFPLQNAHLYLAGEFTKYTYDDDRYRLMYDFDKRAFKKRVLLKNGYYNYVYMRVNHNTSVGQIEYIEGSHFDTNNQYHILVYYYDGYDYYDRLVGYTYLESH
jgi:hypothetical protein